MKKIINYYFKRLETVTEKNINFSMKALIINYIENAQDFIVQEVSNSFLFKVFLLCSEKTICPDSNSNLDHELMK